MRHDYNSQHVNGAFAAVALVLFLSGVCACLALIAWVIS